MNYGIKNIVLFLLFNIISTLFLYAQNNTPDEHQQKAIVSLINEYAQAREKRDTQLLKSILTADIDQLVSTGEWRNGIGSSVEGMLKSSANTPGKRTLNIEKMRMLSSSTAIVDCKYEIQNADSTTRKMWSTFIVVYNNGIWKISAIRNMLPASQ